MNDIRVKKDTPLNLQNLSLWVNEFELMEKSRRSNLKEYYLNKKDLKLPFAKKLVFTSASATIGDGVSLAEPKDLTPKQKQLFDKIMELYQKQEIPAHDKRVVIDGCSTSTGYELYYMSDDENPMPKTAKIDSTNAFVVFDDSVELNSLYAVWYQRYKEKQVDRITLNVADDNFVYSLDYSWESFKRETGDLPGGIPHYVGRVPLTKYWNNDEEQADFEQIVNLIEDRTTLHNLTLADTKKIVKNILALINAQLSGNSKKEKGASLSDINEVPVLELSNPNPNVPANAFMLSKNENYGMIDSFGRDIDSKIYDLAMIPDLTSDTFAGNVTGVALELKLLPFKELVALKEENLKRLYKRRNKCYAYMLTAPIVLEDGTVIESDYEWFDTDNIAITVHRNWTKNLMEISQMILALQTTGLYSDKTLTNLMPDIDYNEEQEQKAVEREDKQGQVNTTADPNNFSLEEFNGILRQE